MKEYKEKKVNVKLKYEALNLGGSQVRLEKTILSHTNFKSFIPSLRLTFNRIFHIIFPPNSSQESSLFL